MSPVPESRRRRRVAVLAGGLPPRTVHLVGAALRRAGLDVSSDPAEADLLVLAHGLEPAARDRRRGAPVLAIRARPHDEERALRRGASGALTLPFDARRLVEWVNRLLLVEDRRRLVANLLGVRRALRRLERERDADRALGFLYWAPKISRLRDVAARAGAKSGPSADLTGTIAREVAARAGEDLFDDLLPLSIDLEFLRRRRIEGLEGAESFAGDGYYRHLLDAKIRLEEVLEWSPVRAGLGRRSAATAWIRTPQLDRLAVEASSLGCLPPLEDALLSRLVRDLRHFHDGLRGRPIPDRRY